MRFKAFTTLNLRWLCYIIFGLFYFEKIVVFNICNFCHLNRLFSLLLVSFSIKTCVTLAFWDRLLLLRLSFLNRSSLGVCTCFIFKKI